MGCEGRVSGRGGQRSYDCRKLESEGQVGLLPVELFESSSEM